MAKEPTITIPIDEEITDPTPAVALSFEETVHSAANSAKMLAAAGLDFLMDANETDMETAHELLESYAADPVATAAAATPARLAKLTPASLILVDTLLQQFGARVVTDSVHVRNLVTNKLLLETENVDPRVRLRALELLGKISDVGLFAEKREVLVTHQTTDDLREKLREKLLQLKDVTPLGSGDTIDG